MSRLVRVLLALRLLGGLVGVVRLLGDRLQTARIESDDVVAASRLA